MLRSHAFSHACANALGSAQIETISSAHNSSCQKASNASVSSLLAAGLYLSAPPPSFSGSLDCVNATPSLHSDGTSFQNSCCGRLSGNCAPRRQRDQRVSGTETAAEEWRRAERKKRAAAGAPAACTCGCCRRPPRRSTAPSPARSRAGTASPSPPPRREPRATARAGSRPRRTPAVCTT